MTRIAFADESGTSGNSPCYAIGVISIDYEDLENFNKEFYRLKKSHGIRSEIKWSKVRNGHGLINFILEWLSKLLAHPSMTFDAIVVHKDLFRNWQGTSLDKEKAFYQTYTYLLRHIAKRTKETAEVLIDDRSDSYSKQHEVVETIGNRMLDQLASKGRLQSVKKVKSHEYPGIQLADVFTGAITSSHILFLKPDMRISKGKKITIKRLAWMLGWDDLCYDTMPHPKFNIWHFPIEYRANPKSVLPVPRNSIPYIKPEELR